MPTAIGDSMDTYTKFVVPDLRTGLCPRCQRRNLHFTNGTGLGWLKSHSWYLDDPCSWGLCDFCAAELIRSRLQCVARWFGHDLHHPFSSPANKDLIERSLVPTDDWMNMQIKRSILKMVLKGRPNGFKPLTFKLACEWTTIDYYVNLLDYMLLFCYGI